MDNVFHRKVLEYRAQFAQYQRLPQPPHASVSVAEGMDVFEFEVEHAAADQQMVLRVLQPVEQFAHQGGHPHRRRRHVHAPLSVEHPHTAAAETACIIYQRLHHNAVGTQHVFLIERVEGGVEFVGLDGVLYLLYLTHRAHHRLALQ